MRNTVWPMLKEADAMQKRSFFSIIVAILLFVISLSPAVHAAAPFAPVIVDDIPVSSFDLSDIGEYTADSYIELNENRPEFEAFLYSEKPFVCFSTFDDLGRTGPGFALLGPETLASEPRGQIGNIRPSGWHTVRYDELIPGRYLYNRAHVIGYQLCGDNATPQNLFTGTWLLNSSTMRVFEDEIALYIARTGNHVLYRVTPVYKGEDLLAAGVQMEALSVEDGGGLHFNVFCYNVQPGIVIRYADGESELDPEYSAPPLMAMDTPDEAPDTVVSRELPVSEGSPAPVIPETSTAEPADDAEITYMLNTNTRRFHYPWCPSVEATKPANRQAFYGTREEAIAMGYSPCGSCHP